MKTQNCNSVPVQETVQVKMKKTVWPGLVFLLFSLLLTACLLHGVEAGVVTSATAPAVTIAPSVGPPTATVFISGSGFDPYAAVDIYFDTTDLALATTDGTGSFGGKSCSTCEITVPTSAVPGKHWISAVERYTLKRAQRTFLVRTNWAQFRFSPSHKGLNPYENVLSPATVGGLDRHWSYLAGCFVSSSPAVANGVVYVGAGGCSTGLYALNASTGALLWKYSTGNSVESSPAVVNGVVYFGTLEPEQSLYALNARTGALLWKYAAVSGIDSSPTVASGVVYFGAGDGNLYALNAGTGAFLWKYTVGIIDFASPTVADGTVYIGSFSGGFYALNARTGALQWKFTTGSYVDSAAAVANGVVYFETVYPDDTLYALNASTGALLWTYPIGGYCSPAVVNGVVYVGSDRSYLYALNASTGAPLWNYPIGGGADSSPAVANGVVYVGAGYNNNNLYALNANTGAPLWQYKTGNWVLSSPTVANGVVYIGSFDGNLYAFDLSSSQSEKRFSPPERPDPNLLQPDWKLEPNTPAKRISSRSEQLNGNVD